MQANTIRKILFFMSISLLPATVYAHHPNGYKLPDSFMEGLLSGFGHPVIGLDHLVFIIGMGVLSYFLRQRVAVPLIFMVSTIVGTVIHLNSINIPLSEALVAVSVALLGLVLLTKSYKQSTLVWYFSFAIAGVLHGYAYGESIVGAEATPLGAYLIGFAVIQLFISYVASFCCQWLSSSKVIPVADFARMYGGIAVCTGAFFLL